MNLCYALLFLFIPLVGQAAPVTESLTDLMKISRDPSIPSETRRAYLDFARKKMKRELSREFAVNETELNLAFVRDPLKAQRLIQSPWNDLQTEFYTTLHQESFTARWNDLQRLVKFSDYGKSIYSTMIGHWGDFSPVDEGRFYLRWNPVGIKSSTRTVNVNLPFFLMAESTPELLKVETYIPFADLLGKDFFAFSQKTTNLAPRERQELAEKFVLNKRIASRVVANGAKTIASLYFLSGHLPAAETESKVRSYITKYCINCSEAEKNDFTKSAMLYVKTLGHMKSPSLKALVGNFCSDLRKNNYQWNANGLKPVPVEVLYDQTKLLEYYLYSQVKKKNREAIAKTVLSQDLGILFLTNAINVLDKAQEPVGTKLGCIPGTESLDIGHVTHAIEEASANVKAYISAVNKEINSGEFTLKKVTTTLNYFVQTNQAATVEAMASFPQGIGHVLKSLAELDQNISRRAKWDKITTWGGTIIGVGLIVSGFFAPEGVAVLISSVGIMKGVAGGSYFLVRAQQEKKFYKEMSLAWRGSNGLSHDLLVQHYQNYKSMKVRYIKEFSGSALEFAKLNYTALKVTKGDPEKSQRLMKKAIDYAKDQGKDQAFDQIQEWIIQFAVGS